MMQDDLGKNATSMNAGAFPRLIALASMFVAMALEWIVFKGILSAFDQLAEGASPDALASSISEWMGFSGVAIGVAIAACVLMVVYARHAERIEGWVYATAGLASIGWMAIAVFWLSAPTPTRGVIYAVLLVAIWVALLSKRPRRGESADRES